MTYTLIIEAEKDLFPIVISNLKRSELVEKYHKYKTNYDYLEKKIVSAFVLVNDGEEIKFYKNMK